MFSRIIAENLFSWTSLDYEVLSGLCLIDGFNHDDNTSEGSGKSAVCNILCWTLYGKIPKDANVDDVVKEGSKYGVGIVELNTGHKIVRARKPNDLRIINPDDTETIGKDAKETQKLIETLIGMSFDTFCQGVYFAQNYPEKFITANEANKAKILSEIQDLSVYDRARKVAGEKERATLDQVKTLEFKNMSKMTSLMDAKENLKNLTSIVEGFYDKQKSQLKDVNSKIEALELKIMEFSAVSTKENLKELENEYKQCLEMEEVLKGKLFEVAQNLANVDKLKRERASLDSRFTRNASILLEYQQEIDSLQNSEGKCPTCGGAFKAEEHKKKIASKLKLLNERVDAAVKERNLIVADRSSVEAVKDVSAYLAEEKELKVELSEINNIKLTIENKKLKLAYAKRDLDNALKNKFDLQITKDQLSKNKPDKELKLVEEAKVKIGILDSEIKVLAEEVQNQTRLAGTYELLKNEFKAVKSFIFTNLLEEISNKSTRLASELFEIPVSIRFFNETEDGELSKIQTEVRLNGVNRGLGLLSGGQASRVQIAVDLALSGIIAARGAKACNFRILDEPFKNLSLQSMEKMVRLLEGLEGVTILIEHSPLIKSIVNNTFFVNYRNGESRHDA